MVVVAMGNGDGVKGVVLDFIIHGYPGPTFQFGVDPGIQQDAKAFHFHHPSTGANALRWIQIRNLHAGSLWIERPNSNVISAVLWKRSSQPGI
jgi:hypothetical protein